jgi:hypothetical protein
LSKVLERAAWYTAPWMAAAICAGWNPGRLPAYAWLRCYERFWTEQLGALGALLQAGPTEEGEQQMTAKTQTTQPSG